MEETIKFRFEDLIVYQKAIDFIDLIFQITNTFPKVEQYSLTSQFRRVANSIALNIAEGSSGSKNQFSRYLFKNIERFAL